MRNIRIRWIEHSTTTRTILTNVFGLRRVFIRLMKSLCVGQQPTSISAILADRLALVKESIEFTMGVNKFQKLYVIKNLHPVYFLQFQQRHSVQSTVRKRGRPSNASRSPMVVVLYVNHRLMQCDNLIDQHRQRALQRTHEVDHWLLRHECRNETS